MVRRLKLNTIYDHLVEIALYDDEFPLSKYVNSTEQTEIEKAAQKTLSYKLKILNRKSVNPSVIFRSGSYLPQNDFQVNEHFMLSAATGWILNETKSGDPN